MATPNRPNAAQRRAIIQQRQAARAARMNINPRQRTVNPVAQSLLNVGIAAKDVRTASLFCYQAGAITTAASASGTANIQIQADSTFELQRLAFYSIAAAVVTAVTLPPILIQITDTASGANIFDQPMPLFTIAYGGAGFGPFDVPDARFFAPNSTVTITLTNLDAASAYTTRVNLQGRKLFA